MTKYVEIEEGFLSAVNIAYDLYNDKKIQSFIPTFGSIDILEEQLLSTHENSVDRARILIGAYGKGKSHIILVLLAILYRKDPALFSTLLEEINKHKPELHQYILEYLHGDKRLLPIVIQGSNASLTQSFLSAIQKAMEGEELSDLMPETHFQAALNAIARWEMEYPDTYNQFLEELNVPIDEFMMDLGDFNVSAYEKFEILYPTLTSGSQFNPFLGFDVVELYSQVVDALCKRGYAGIFVVYDEFSKYLESSITKASISDIKMLQDFAERCNRSKEKQMHLLLISHKDIVNYIDKLPKQKVDGWKGVSERFKHVEQINNFSQIYEIIAAVIKKKDAFYNVFFTENKNRFMELKNTFIDGELFSELEPEDIEPMIVGCYPLHPVTTFILPRLSELVAQNERTLFTFLSANHKNTLIEFLRERSEKFPLLKPDKLYDYFEPLFKKEPYTSEIRNIYNIASAILTQIDLDTLEAKIIKTIAIIDIIKQPVKLPPVAEIIIKIYGNSVEEAPKVAAALEDLQNKKFVVYVSRKTTHLKLKNPIGSDIRKKIIDLAEKNKSFYDVKAILAELSTDLYLYPTSYNDDMEIIRYFDFSFISGREFLEVDDWSKKIQHIKADGIVYGILPENTEQIHILEKELRNKININDRILFILPNQYTEISDIAYEYKAVKMIKEASIEDTVLIAECNLYEDDLLEVMESYILSFTKPEMRKAVYYYQGEKKLFNRKAQLSKCLSDICNKIFFRTPVIKNESLNKNELPSVAIRSRNRVVHGLLATKLEPMLGLTGTSQEVSFMRSSLIVTGLLQNHMSMPYLQLFGLADDALQNVLNQIEKFFMDSGNPQGKSFEELYDTLTKPEYHIGLKRGVIPLYIASMLHQYKEHLAIMYKDSEIEITPDLLNSINENPYEYTAYLESWSPEKTEYINKLELLYYDFIVEREKEFNSFSYIIRAMQRWFISLPKYTRDLKEVYQGSNEFNKINKENKKFMNSLMQPSINAREYLFEKLFRIYDYSEFTTDIIQRIADTKDAYDSAKDQLITTIQADLIKVFNTEANTPSETSLVSIIKDWVDTLNKETTNHVFNGSNGKIFQLINSITNDHILFTKGIAKAATGLRIDDWNEGVIKNFITAMQEFKKLVEQYDQNLIEEQAHGQDGNNDYMLTIRNANGEKLMKNFTRIEYSPRGKLLKNDINSALEEMGQSISDEEKRQVLLEILENMF
ncbi:hypothetical protein AKG39_10375 [Acetobacterium bakii]|uniref:Uncharacterized protein n=1 Tax=Acetobacterium bakii TaxID=52689 RepID=A0A0L6U053_9FIRM|nr:hypothetical protein AKG39_10375 [Acetobacterium bakii]